MTIATNILHWGDNLPILRDFPPDCIDLIYLDPPFNSKRDYNAIFKDETGSATPAQIKAFTDTWKWHMAVDAYKEMVSKGGTVSKLLSAMHDALGTNDVLAYISMMALRICELHRILKSDGSLFLHCDPTASHYLKLLLDAQFGKMNYRNEIIWHYRKWPSGRSQFQRNHDVVFFYTKTNEKSRHFKAHMMERTASTIKRFGTKKIISGYDEQGKRIPSKMADEDSPGVWGDDVWDIPRIPPIKQRYETQKPPALLKRIIETASEENDIVLDPFAGCGTAIVEAHRAKRRWIGIDITYWAIHTIEEFMIDEFGSMKIPVIGRPTTYDEALKLAEISPLDFEQWAVMQFERAKPTGGKPIDGEIPFIDDKSLKGKRVVIEVTTGKPNKKHFDAFLNHVNKAEMGIYVLLHKPSKGMVADAKEKGVYHSEGWGKDFPKVQICEVNNLFDGIKPVIPLPYVKKGKGVLLDI
ncbi:MAG: site-specific DNA-methyltransferase [Dehalococcoidales bacterium]|nr:site-specific DNA-methyltransferase [Dehalococcoidales bacterium]